jgi:predicted nucleic-acid-binding Zn-ribbon protein
MSDDVELCPKCGQGNLRLTAEAAPAGESTELFIETSYTHIYVCDNCGHKKPKTDLKEYTAVSDTLSDEVIRASERTRNT